MPVRYGDQGSIADEYSASAAGLTCRISALRLSWTDLSRIASSSACCVCVLNPGREGQSMLLTDAIHAARNSRVIGGGAVMGAGIADGCVGGTGSGVKVGAQLVSMMPAPSAPSRIVLCCVFKCGIP